MTARKRLEIALENTGDEANVLEAIDEFMASKGFERRSVERCAKEDMATVLINQWVEEGKY